MSESSDVSTAIDRIRSWARSKAHASSYNPFAGDCQPSGIPLTPSRPERKERSANGASDGLRCVDEHQPSESTANHVAVSEARILPPPAPPPPNSTPATVAGDGSGSDGILVRFFQTTKKILFASWINVLLVFVPVGIVVEFIPASPTVVFAMNAIAIVPLAGLLSYATESVAWRLGDTVGALLNVTFGNAVEVIIL